MPDHYTTACKEYSFYLPPAFNFGFDIIDERAQVTPERVAYIAVDRLANTVRHTTYKELSQASNRFANVLTGLGAVKGDFALVVIERIPAWF